MIIDNFVSEPRFYHPAWVFQELAKAVGFGSVGLASIWFQALLLFSEAGGGGGETFLDWCRSVHQCGPMWPCFG